MLAEHADRLEEADKLWNAFYLSTFITDTGRPTDAAVNLLFLSVPFSVFFLIRILFSGLI